MHASCAAVRGEKDSGLYMWSGSVFLPCFCVVVVKFKFGQVGGQWEATEILHSDSDHKPFKYADQDYFKSPLATAFSCSKHTEVAQPHY